MSLFYKISNNSSIFSPPNIRLHDKVWIPQEAHPEINFVGLLIGPRGNTLKALEQEVGEMNLTLNNHIRLDTSEDYHTWQRIC